MYIHIFKHDYHILWYIIYKIFMLSNTYINICCAFLYKIESHIKVLYFFILQVTIRDKVIINEYY